jgi:hypothetical protein
MCIEPFVHLHVSNHRASFGSLAEIRLLYPYSSGLFSVETFDTIQEYLMKMKITILSKVQPTSVFFILYIAYHHSVHRSCR